ncbi:MAG: hypothetical protein DMF69_01000 [Acidobacteria bacterium]|nr:MAG: hypothetical protein DMF69_01000 [Acidobacteriota bacterium]
MFQSLGLSGQPFVGSDVGGFMGRGNGELLTRSYQVSFLAPFCRNHKTIDGYDQEPWRFGKHYEDIIRKYLKLRYELMPFLYTTLETAHRTGVPLFRPLVLNYQDDSSTYNLDDQFMVGDDLLVAPILSAGLTNRLVYLPRGSWYDFWTNKKYSGETMIRVDAPLETVPMFVRGGAIIPKGQSMNFVGEKPAAPLFVIYPDAQGKAQTSLYEDDGVSPGYKQGLYRRTGVQALETDKGINITVEAPQGSFKTPSRILSFLIPTRLSPTQVVLDGRTLSKAGQDGSGWQKSGEILTVRIVDDGKAHSINIR